MRCGLASEHARRAPITSRVALEKSMMRRKQWDAGASDGSKFGWLHYDAYSGTTRSFSAEAHGIE